MLLAVGVVPWGPASLSVNAADDPSSDIPGVALPGPVSAGRLGGAIYDVVYQFTVAPGRVIVANLTGPAATDFDLYLFDSSASTVLSEVGLLKKSTGPTSGESISWPSPLGGVYYVDLNGATDVEGDYRLTVQTVPDPTPPAVSMALAEGRSSTNQLTVPVTVTAVDDLSGIAEMAFSSDGSVYGPWVPFQRASTWTFPPSPGPRTLWAKVSNGVGLESASTSATITIDLVAPVVTAVDPAPASSVIGLRSPFSVTFNEAIDPVTWSDSGLIVQSATGTLVGGQYAYDPVRWTGTFVPSLPLQAGAAYVVTVGGVTDVAGNRVSPIDSWTVTPLALVSLEAKLQPTVVGRGGSASLDLTLAGAPLPAIVEISARSGVSVEFLPLSGPLIVNGRLATVVTPEMNTTYRIRYAGAFGVASAQADLPLLVRRSAVLIGPKSASVATARVGASVKLVAAIEPAAPGISVSFRLYRYVPASRAWVYSGSWGRSTDAAGRATYPWKPTAASSYYWRVSVVSTAEYANNVSPVYRWSVTR